MVQQYISNTFGYAYCYGGMMVITFCQITVCFLFFPLYLLCFLHAEHLTQVHLEEVRASQEMNAMQEFDKGEANATKVPQLLEKLSRPGQIPLYYCGGLEILSQAVTDCKCSFGRSLFLQLSFSFNLFVPTLTSITCFTDLPTVFPGSMAKSIRKLSAFRLGLRRLTWEKQSQYST